MIKKYRVHYEVELNDGSDETALETFDIEAGDEQEALESMLSFETGYVNLSSIEVEELEVEELEVEELEVEELEVEELEVEELEVEELDDDVTDEIQSAELLAMILHKIRSGEAKLHGKTLQIVLDV